MRLFGKLKRKLNYLVQDEIEKIYQAYLFADKAHATQVRVSGKPYITHPVSVAMILASLHMDHHTIIAALLHDVIEDTDVSKQQISQQFGQTVSELVDGVSKLTQIKFNSKAEAQAENFRKMVLAMSKDIRVIIIKLADRMHNMSTIESMPLAKRRQKARETLDIYAPIASRLGMHERSIELEELAFKTLYPHRYRALRIELDRARGDRKSVLKQIEKNLNQALQELGIPQFEVFGREKHLYSIYKKMKKKRVKFSDVMDIHAFRIVVDNKDTCYRVLGAIHSMYKPVPERFKDYIALPKTNGYQALHTTLFGPFGLAIEIQIRTKEMDELAEQGIAAHWLYKVGDKYVSLAQVKSQQWLKSILEMQRTTGNSLEFIENVKVDLFPNEVYVFTPKGGILELPTGATPVDFAYAVHTDVGNACVSAKIDRKTVPLSCSLLNGQTIEIVTSSRAKPNPTWLSFVVTAKARSCIRNYLKQQREKQSLLLGKQLFSRALAYYSIRLNKVDPEQLERFLKEINANSLEDFFVDLGLGNRLAQLEAHRFVNMMGEQHIRVDEQEVEIEPMDMNDLD